MRLAESFKKELFEVMPTVALIPILKSKYSQAGCYPCPLYKTTQRKGELSTTGHSTNFVLFLDIPSDQNPNHWIRRGVALLCQPDE